MARARFVACGSVLVALVVAPVPAADASPTGDAPPAGDAFPFEPDDRAETELTLGGTTWSHEGSSVTIHLRRLDDGERLRLFTNRTGHAIDPFAGPPEVEPAFVTFLLVVENRGQGDVQFNPGHSWLVTNKQRITTPIGLTDLGFDYRAAGRELPEAYEHARPVLLDHAHAVPPGGELAGLLVYRTLRTIENGTKRFRVDIELTMPDGEVVTFAAPYRRIARRGSKP